MEESTQEDNQTNERYSINFSSPIKYEKEIANTQPGETRNFNKNFFTLGDRNILISSSPKLANESLIGELTEKEIEDKNMKEGALKSNHDRKRSVSDLDKSLSIDIQQYDFPAQKFQIGEIYKGAITQPHKNLNHIFISLEDKNNPNRHMKNVKSDVLVNQNIQRTFDDLLKRKEDKENQTKSHIEITKRQLLESFFNLDKENKEAQLNQREGLSTIYENNVIENSLIDNIVTPRDSNHECIKNKYKKERRKKSSIFSSEDLRISKTDAIDIKDSQFVLQSPICDKINTNTNTISKDFEEDKDQYMNANRQCITDNENRKGINRDMEPLKIEKAEVVNIIMSPNKPPAKDMKLQVNKQKTYSMVFGAKLSYETLKKENTKQAAVNSESKDQLHSKANSLIPSYQMKPVRQLNIKKISIKPNSSKGPLHTNNPNDYSSNKMTTLPSTRQIKSKGLMKTHIKARNISNPNRSQLTDKVTNKQETIKLVSSDAMKYNKKSDKNNVLQLLMKFKEGCYVVFANEISKAPNTEGKRQSFLFKGLYEYSNSKEQIEKVFGDIDCKMIIKRNEVISKLKRTDTPQQININLPCGSSLIMINNI